MDGCNVRGRSLRSKNYSLYSLIGTTYGGDGRDTFQLPDLRGRTAVDSGLIDGHDRPVNGHAGLPAIGSHGGAEHVTLTLSQMPPPQPPGHCRYCQPDDRLHAEYNQEFDPVDRSEAAERLVDGAGGTGHLWPRQKRIAAGPCGAGREDCRQRCGS